MFMLVESKDRADFGTHGVRDEPSHLPRGNFYNTWEEPRGLTVRDSPKVHSFF